MPFDYEDYALSCTYFSEDELRLEYQRYSKLLGSSSASTGLGLGLAFFTFGISLIGTAAGAVSGRNAMKKMKIIETECQRRGIDLTFRKRDFFKGYGVGATVGVVSHGAGGHLMGSALHHVTSNAISHAGSHAVTQGLQHTTSASSVTPSSHSFFADLVERGTDKACEKGGDALEKHVYGERLFNEKWTHLAKAGDSKSNSIDSVKVIQALLKPFPQDTFIEHPQQLPRCRDRRSFSERAC